MDPVQLIRLFVVAASVSLLAAQAPDESPAGGSSPTAAEEAATSGAPPQAPPEARPSAAPGATPEATPEEDRTRLNLLGEVDSKGGEGRRNENVRLALIDNNVLRELNQRLGVTTTVVSGYKIDQGYFGGEYGGSPSRPLHLPPARAQGVHGNLFWTHNNSAFTARSFFQVGDVQPARSNNYGFKVGLPVWKGGAFTVEASQTKNRGQVNGNVLVPAADERTPLTNDPLVRPIVERILAAYPAETPNRTDINPRALNTNSPQDIDNDRIGGTLDQSLGDDDRLTVRYSFFTQNVTAFQLVGGQNPDTTTRNHQVRLTWNRTWDPATTTDVSVAFDRVGSLLIPDETSLGPWYRIGQELDSIGPPGRFPVDRAQNTFRYAARLRRERGRHALTAGFDMSRRQINGSEVQDHRGRFIFRRNFGRDAVSNLRMGTPSNYLVAIGNVHRGFRRWFGQMYVGDRWKATSNFTVNLGLRWEPVTRPTEVNNLTNVPYGSDLNNFAPRLGLAYRLPGRWGSLRASYGLHYGEIFTATYIQARINPPQNLTVVVQTPNLANPLGGLDPSALDPTARSSAFDISPDLATPYSHVYNFAWELEVGRDWTLELGYVGSRSYKLLAMWFRNRGQVVEGIAQTTRTINQRRPDPRFFEIQNVVNGSNAYYDAAKATLRIPSWAGVSVEASYWFSKAIDLGGDYSNTASNANRRLTAGPTEFDTQKELKGLSNFDQPHAMLWNFSYQTPALSGRPHWLRGILGGWQLSSAFLAKAGAPFSVLSGSDAPGFGNVDGSQSDTPILLDPSILGRSIDHPDTSVESLPASAFGFIGPTDLRGNLGRNTFRRDGIFNINLALSKRWTVAGDAALLFRVESLNLSNHPQFAPPGSALAFRNFGQITNTLNDGRTFRFRLQLDF